MDKWVYTRSADGAARFILGVSGSNPLVCFGVNPSTAAPNALDPTVRRVSRFAEDNGFDGWMMVNLYPQISTHPSGLHHVCDAALKNENERHIASVIEGRPLTLLAAWGNLIDSRPHLSGLAHDIFGIPELARCTWVSLGPPTKAGHPRHPLYAPARLPLEPFDVPAYASRLG